MKLTICIVIMFSMAACQPAAYKESSNRVQAQNRLEEKSKTRIW